MSSDIAKWAELLKAAWLLALLPIDRQIQAEQEFEYICIRLSSILQLDYQTTAERFRAYVASKPFGCRTCYYMIIGGDKEALAAMGYQI